MKSKSKERKIRRINKLLTAYMDNPDARNAKKLLARQTYIKNQSSDKKRTHTKT